MWPHESLPLLSQICTGLGLPNRLIPKELSQIIYPQERLYEEGIISGLWLDWWKLTFLHVLTSTRRKFLLCLWPSDAWGWLPRDAGINLPGGDNLEPYPKGRYFPRYPILLLYSPSTSQRESQQHPEKKWCSENFSLFDGLNPAQTWFWKFEIPKKNGVLGYVYQHRHAQKLQNNPQMQWSLLVDVSFCTRQQRSVEISQLSLLFTSFFNFLLQRWWTACFFLFQSSKIQN